MHCIWTSAINANWSGIGRAIWGFDTQRVRCSGQLGVARMIGHAQHSCNIMMEIRNRACYVNRWPKSWGSNIHEKQSRKSYGWPDDIINKRQNFLRDCKTTNTTKECSIYMMFSGHHSRYNNNNMSDWTNEKQRVLVWLGTYWENNGRIEVLLMKLWCNRFLVALETVDCGAPGDFVMAFASSTNLWVMDFWRWIFTRALWGWDKSVSTRHVFVNLSIHLKCFIQNITVCSMCGNIGMLEGGKFLPCFWLVLREMVRSLAVKVAFVSSCFHSMSLTQVT